MPEVIVQDNDVIGTEPVIPEAETSIYNVAKGARYTKLTITGSQVVKFSTKYNVFGVKGDNIVASLTSDTEGDGVYSTADGDGSIIIAHYSNRDTLYLTGTGDVIVWAGNSPSDCPFKKTGKGGGATYLGETTTEIESDSDVNPIIINNQEVTAKAGDVVKYIYTYYAFDGSVWSEFIDTSYLITGMIEDEVIIGELIPVYPTTIVTDDSDGVYSFLAGGYLGTITTVDWGDGTVDIHDARSELFEHTYTIETIRTITITASGGKIKIDSKQGENDVKATSIIFGTDVEAFGDLYSDKDSLTEAVFKNPDTILSFPNWSFFGCTALISVELPSRLKTIPARTFENSTLRYIGIPDTVTSIGDTAFKNCDLLEWVAITAIVPPTLGTDVFSGCTSLTSIMVPAPSVEAYKEAWSEYASLIE